jgi:hypothetical protein
MTQDIDLISTRARELAEELRVHLSERFHIAVGSRVIGEGKGYRLVQMQETFNRHLVDIRPADSLPHSQPFEGVQVVAPPQLIAQKAISFHSRQGQPKGFSDMRDLAMLFLTFPEMKRNQGSSARL